MICEACSTHRGDEKCIKHEMKTTQRNAENTEARDDLRDLEIYWWIVLK
jgi:hypothetical protein